MSFHSIRDQESYAQAFAGFVEASPTSYHAVSNAAELLKTAGFRELTEARPWSSQAGSAGFVRREGAIVAWRVGAHAAPDAPMRIIGAHSDSPGFKVKPDPDTVTGGWSQLNVEVYGGPQYSTWLDRDLAIAGLVIDVSGEHHLINTGPVARIPSLAIHLDRDANKGLWLDPQQHLHPVLGVSGESARELIAQAAGISVGQLSGWDLQLADTQGSRRIGASGDFLASGRLDNLTGTFAGLYGLVDASVPDTQLALTVIYDHEEVGSQTYSGAYGTFLADVYARLLAGLAGSDTVGFEQLARARARSWILSIDAGHSVHPNYVEKHDPQTQPVAGSGAMLKVNAQQRYIGGARGMALWQRVAASAGVATQVFVSNNSVPCGSTIGPITAANVGIAAVDAGVPLLSMHSVRELVHVADLWSMAQISSVFLSEVTE